MIKGAWYFFFSLKITMHLLFSVSAISFRIIFVHYFPRNIRIHPITRQILWFVQTISKSVLKTWNKKSLFGSNRIKKKKIRIKKEKNGFRKHFYRTNKWKSLSFQENVVPFATETVTFNGMKNNQWICRHIKKENKYGGISEGRPLILPKQWDRFETQSKDIDSFCLKIERKWKACF